MNFARLCEFPGSESRLSTGGVHPAKQVVGVRLGWIDGDCGVEFRHSIGVVLFVEQELAQIVVGEPEIRLQRDGSLQIAPGCDVAGLTKLNVATVKQSQGIVGVVAELCVEFRQGRSVVVGLEQEIAEAEVYVGLRWIGLDGST